ncbi:MAG: prefoldin subunit alpha [Nanoarchaeota archaeon]
MASRQEEQQKKAIEFQILYSQLEQYQTQLANLQQQKQNLNNLSLSLEEVSKLKKGDEFLSPLSSGVLVKTELKEHGNVLMAVGANVIVKKKIEDAELSVKEQEKQITLFISQLKSEAEKLAQVVYSLQQEIEQT